jgi:hypothetical protein
MLFTNMHNRSYGLCYNDFVVLACRPARVFGNSLITLEYKGTMLCNQCSMFSKLRFPLLQM